MTPIVLLGDISLVRNGKSNSQDSVTDGKYPFFDRSQIIKKSNQYLFDTDGIIIPGEGKEFTPRFFSGKFDLHQRAYVIQGDQNKVDDKYLYYAILSGKDYLSRTAVGSTVKSLRKPQIERMPIPLPMLNTQAKIADILGSIDEKIELNRKMNDTLEQMGQVLFRFQFINNPEARKWEIKRVSEIIDFVGGSQPPKTEHVYEKRDGYIRFIQNRDYSSNNHKTYIPNSSRNKICNETDIMMDKYGEAGKVRFGIAGAYNVALSKIIPKLPNTQEYLRAYFSLPNTQRILESAAAASTRSSLNSTTFAGLEIHLPPSELLSRFENAQKTAIYKQMLCRDEIQTLTTLRDTLLPRLISGKLKV